MTLLIQCPQCKKGLSAKPTTKFDAVLRCRCGAAFTRPPPPRKKAKREARAS